MLFTLINIIAAIIIAFLTNIDAIILGLIAIIILHYTIINMNCQRLRDSGFQYIKYYVFITLGVYILSFVLMALENFDCDGYGIPLFLIWYFTTFSLLLVAPTYLSNK